nr:MAG TPA: hypothetical protein [Caudoviricetes sp.]
MSILYHRTIMVIAHLHHCTTSAPHRTNALQL